MDKILARQLSALVNSVDPYIDPEELGQAIMPVVVGLFQNAQTVSHLSDAQKNWYLERHQAGLLAYMMKCFADARAIITVRFVEDQDFDCVIRAVIEGYAPIHKRIQLKQLASHEQSKSLQALIDGLKSKYPTSSDLVVAIWINRDTNLEFENLDFRGLKLEQLWFFGVSALGDLTLEGGLVSDLVSGLRWTAIMYNDKRREVRPVKFKPVF
jgi:hypothetical protein